MEVVVIAHDGHEEILDFQSLFIHLQPVCESVPIVTAVFPRLPERIGRTEEYLPVIGKIVAQDFHDRRSGGGVLRPGAGRQAVGGCRAVQFQSSADLFEVVHA